MPYLLCLPNEKQLKTDWYNKFWYNQNKLGVEVIKVMEKEPKISTNVQIDGKTYRINGIYYNHNNEQHLVRTTLIEFLEEPKSSIEDKFICPFCNHIHKNLFKNKVHVNFSDEGHQHCENCGSKFQYEVSVKISYKIIPKRKSKIIEI